MSAVSKAQQRFFQIAEHRPDLLRGPKPKMTHQQLHDFASGSEKGKPEHVSKRASIRGLDRS